MTRKSVEGAYEIYFDKEDEEYITFAPGELRPNLSKETWLEYVGSAENVDQVDKSIKEHAATHGIQLEGDKKGGGYEGI